MNCGFIFFQFNEFKEVHRNETQGYKVFEFIQQQIVKLPILFPYLGMQNKYRLYLGYQ